MEKNVKNKIIMILQWEVIADADVADLYNVETKRINEAVKNNLDKFRKTIYLKLLGKS